VCGIAAFFSSEGPVTADVLRIATHRLAHRGLNGQRQRLAADAMKTAEKAARPDFYECFLFGGP
jgi:hypothetical protein